MKKALLMALVVVASVTKSQCFYSCADYSVSPITFSMYPATGDTLVMADDEITTSLPIGFNFDFYCNTYNQLRICSNGFITFDFSFISPGNTPYAQNLPSTVTPNGVIAWNWNDLDPSQGGTVTYTTSGTSPNQRFILTYSNVPLWTPNNPPSNLRNTGQIVLHEATHLIEIHVKEATNNGWLTHTEGIEAPSATAAVIVPGRNLALWTASLSSHLFSPYLTGSAPQLSGDTILCRGEPGSYLTTTLTNALGYHWTFPPGWTGSGNTASITAISGSAGQVSVAAIYTCGNSPPAIIAVNVVSGPSISIASAGPSVVCSGSAYTIVPSGASFYTLDPGNHTGNSTLVVFPDATTIYTLTGYGNSSGCNSINTRTASVVVKQSPTISVNSGSICKGGSFTMIPSGSFQYTYSSGFPTVTPPTAGLYNYSVTTTGQNGCISQPAISTVSVAPLPNVTAVPSSTRICVKESATLIAFGAQTYTWTGLFGSGNSVTVSPPFSMVYSVIGKDQNGCVNHANVSITVDKCVGIPEETRAETKIYPNPSGGALVINSSVAGAFTIYDCLGRSVQAGTLAQGTNILQINESMVNGFYYFTLDGNAGRESFLLLRD